ncbi:hypothetical protein JI435_129110 [Parastagonospora nodorum SN15]|uniref:Uncharacterized protein n=1 Tax=Phaeosphaeria nodorum (strain SN15 / ATCC MYA-4574 / FGSC 10173) TaxID=321614 RepID=A0A7U2I838_PHANO|nr:hypothetical protein JI435_129110 [Parastagonospora nodorum SN15]
MHLSTILSVAFAALALAHPNNVAKREAQVTEENPPLEARAPQITESPAALLDADGLEERAAQVTEDDPVSNFLQRKKNMQSDISVLTDSLAQGQWCGRACCKYFACAFTYPLGEVNIL